MTAALRRLVALTDVPRSRVALSVLLGAATVVFGAGLMATAGYLISRAAEQPPILSLTVAIVAIRFFGLARPLARYLERLVSHDLALRVLTRVRVRAYERIEPLAPAELEGYRRGDLLSRLVADVDSLQNLHLRGFHPLLVAAVSGAVCVGVTAAFLPVAALVLACGLLLAGVAVPLVSGRLARWAAERQAVARGRLAAELVELLQSAPELVVYGREGERLARVRAADRLLVRIGRRDALAAGIGDGLQLCAVGATVAGVLWVSVEAHAEGRLDRVLIAMLALLASPPSTPSSPSPARSGTWARRSPPGSACWSWSTVVPGSPIPTGPLRCRRSRPPSAWRTSSRAMGPTTRRYWRERPCGSSRAAASLSSGRAGRGRRP